MRLLHYTLLKLLGVGCWEEANTAARLLDATTLTGTQRRVLTGLPLHQVQPDAHWGVEGDLANHGPGRTSLAGGMILIHAFLAMMETLKEEEKVATLQWSPKVGEERAVFKQLAAEVDVKRSTASEMNILCPFCSIKATFQGTKKKLLYRVTDGTMARALGSALEAIGGEEKVGRAPAGALERILSDALGQGRRP